METRELDWEDEFERFKKCKLNTFNSEYLEKFEYSEVHHKYTILPKGFDYGENDLGESSSCNSFKELNFAWDMWVGCLLEKREGDMR